MSTEQKSQIKSRQRVVDRGEVFTNEREVKAMCDLVKDETERIDSRFLEPACGDGNFLAEILTRKLQTARRKYGKSAADFERYSVLAVTSIYGVDIMQDNVLACRERMYGIWHSAYADVCKKDINELTCEAVRYILSKNIVLGNALTMKCVDGDCKDLSQPIVFAEWAFVGETNIKRRDFRFDELLSDDRQEHSLFSLDWEFDAETQTYMPCPIREYAPTHFRRVQENG